MKNTWIVSPMALWLRRVISMPRSGVVLCCGYGDVVKSIKGLTVVKIQHVGCVSENLMNLGENWT